jgi:membrane fusion protein, multidrug efflux system
MRPAFKYLLLGGFFSLLAATAVALKILPSQQAAPPRTTTASRGDRGKSHEPERSDGGKELVVATYKVQPVVLEETISATGTLRADESVELQAEASGKVIAIAFVEGSQVKQGDLLVKLNDAPLRATLARATQKKELAQAQERRLATLVAQKLVPQYDYDAVRSEVRVQEAEIALTQAQIAETEIRAPFDGVVGLRFVSMGAYVNTNTRIATLQQLDRLKIDFSVPEKYAAQIKPGTPVTFRTADGLQHKGEIYAVDPRIDSSTRTVLGRAICRNDRGRLLPGAFASVEIALARIDDAMLIPAQALIPGLDDRSVFVLQNGKAQRRSIQTGTRNASTVHVLAGLAIGDEVITSGLVQLRAGQAVTASTAPPPVP